MLTTVVILSMAVTPLLMLAADRLLNTKASTDDVDTAYDQKGRILLIGFGRFGQIVSQVLLSKGISLAVIDIDPDSIRDAGRFGFKVYYGDGARLDTLRQSGRADGGRSARALGRLRNSDLCPTERIGKSTSGNRRADRCFDDSEVSVLERSLGQRSGGDPCCSQ